MINMTSKKIIIIIFLLAFAMRLLALFSFAGEKSLLYVNDSQTYLQTAKNILEHGVYSMEISDTPHPDNFRTPLYPLFLLPFVWLKTSLYIPAMIQSLIMSFGAGLVFWLGQKIFNRRVAIISATLSALEPLGSLFSAQIMTEAIFTTLFILAILFLGLYLKTQTRRSLFIGSALLALSALARPIAFYLFLILPLAVYMTKNNWRVKIKTMLVSLGLFFLITSPWLYFIVFKAHSYSFSSIIGMQLYEYHGRYFDEWRAEHGAPANDRLPYVDLSPINNTLNAQAIPPVKTVGVTYIKAHFPQYLLFYFSRIPNLFIDSGYTTIINGIAPIKNWLLSTILFIASSFFIITSLLAVFNPLFYYKINHLRQREKIFLIIVILLYTAIASPISVARFRIPINPFLFLLAIDSVFLLRQFYQIRIADVKNNL